MCKSLTAKHTTGMGPYLQACFQPAPLVSVVQQPHHSLPAYERNVSP